ncbi:hypothetical protein XELAEV_18014654mg [Xenopus laevis]|uniref:Vomeronasal type-1 receptor n=1 Tax=Xenopus laevis TaxID=8355 RepID=A0A974HVC9_XENLA|nr:hypothetical protein XELAEV_18014654mg [Xenopus laevis]
MDPFLLLKAIGFLLLVIIGVPGNVFIMMQLTCFRIFEKKLSSTNIILMVLSLVNLLVILSRIIPQSINELGVEELLDDTECKLIIFTYRCILIAPNTNYGFNFKHKVTQNLVAIIFLFWIINIAIYPYFILNTLYCDADFLNYMAYIVNGAIYSFCDVIFVGLMVVANSYMVFILLSHERSVKGIHSSDRMQGRSVEYRASKAVMLLVVLYILLYGLDNCFWIYTLTLSNFTPSTNEIQIFLASSYSSFSLIVIIITKPKLQQESFPCSREGTHHFKINECVYSISK